LRIRTFVTELAAAGAVAALSLPGIGKAQPLGPGPRAEIGPLVGEMLPPRDVVARVRSAGFNPVSRPVQRGPVYVVFAVDRYFMNVRVTVDARSGRVMAVTRLAGVPGYGGYEVVPGAPPGLVPPYGERPPRAGERAPVPPADVPLYGGNHSSPPEDEQSVEVAKRLPQRPPLPRARPESPESASEPLARSSVHPRSATTPASLAVEAPAESQAAAPPPASPAPAAAQATSTPAGTGSKPAIGLGEPSKPAVQADAASTPAQQPAMIPVAPLE
jgi:hypothetical protein